MKGIQAPAFILIASFIADLPAAFAEVSVDWKYYGGFPIEGDSLSLCFYDANGVVQDPEHRVKVWIKCLPESALNRIDIQKDFGGQIAKNAAQKIADYYVPPIAMVEEIDFDHMIGIAAYEEIANIGHLQPQARIFYELNCSERMLRELSINVQAKSESGSSDVPRDWKYVPPEGNAARLLKILCPK